MVKAGQKDVDSGSDRCLPVKTWDPAFLPFDLGGESPFFSSKLRPQKKWTELRKVQEPKEPLRWLEELVLF